MSCCWPCPPPALTQARTEPIVGLFANTLVIRTDLSGDPSLGQLADRLHAANARAQPHQELPFARVVELSRPQRRLGRSPLVQVLCAVEDAWPDFQVAGMSWRPELTDNGTGKFELELTVTARTDGLAGKLRYRTDLFEPATARLVADGLALVFDAMAADPRIRLSELEILPAPVRELVTSTSQAGGSAAPTPAPPSVVTLAAVACAADRIVISGSDASLTGPQLRGRAEAIAASLAALGLSAQDNVGILLPRGARLLAAVLGTWWAGTAYVPIDPVQPARRIAGMLADANVRALISDRAALGPLLAELDGDLPVVDLARALDATSAATVPAGSLPPELPPQAAAYVLFTSGSTGRPKAVTVTHGALAQLLAAFGELLPLGPGDRLAAVTSIGFDISILELLLPLIAGSQVVVADADQAADGTGLRRLLIAAEVTALQATPVTWRLLIAAGGVPDQVRLRICGGEPLPRDLADALADGPGAQLWNVYGPTETTVWSTAGLVAAGAEVIDVGTAIAGTRVHVLDRWLNPAPPGVTGEVYVGGAGLARGYAGAPGLTATRFVPDPFGDPGSRLYRTGDLGRWLRSGRLQLQGRIDRQLKIRGFRVEAAEIETALRAHPHVTDAVVIASAGSEELRLVGYIQAAATDPVDELRAYLHELLPDYLIPDIFVPVAELPRSASGKIDYQALPAPAERQASSEPVAPRTPLEAELADLFALVLRRSSPVGALDNFFVLGGHSLTATQVMAQIWSSYGVDLPVRTLFADPTVAGLATAITAAGPTGDAAIGTAGDQPDFADFIGALTDADLDDLLRDA